MADLAWERQYLGQIPETKRTREGFSAFDLWAAYEVVTDDFEEAQGNPRGAPLLKNRTSCVLYSMAARRAVNLLGAELGPDELGRGKILVQQRMRFPIRREDVPDPVYRRVFELTEKMKIEMAR